MYVIIYIYFAHMLYTLLFLYTIKAYYIQALLRWILVDIAVFVFVSWVHEAPPSEGARGDSEAGRGV